MKVKSFTMEDQPFEMYQEIDDEMLTGLLIDLFAPNIRENYFVEYFGRVTNRHGESRWLIKLRRKITSYIPEGGSS